MALGLVLSVSLLCFATASDVLVWSSRNALLEDSSTADWDDVSSKLLDLTRSVDIVCIIAAEDDGSLTELKSGDRLVIRRAPENIENTLLEVAQERHGAENVQEVAAEDLLELEVSSSPSVYVVRTNANSVGAAGKFIGDLEHSDRQVAIFAIVGNVQDKKTWSGRRLLGFSYLADDKLRNDTNRIFVRAEVPSIEGFNKTKLLLSAKELAIKLPHTYNSTFSCCGVHMNDSDKVALRLEHEVIYWTGNNTNTLFVKFNVSEVFHSTDEVSNASIGIYVTLKNSFWSVNKMEFAAIVNDSATCTVLSSPVRQRASYQDSIRDVPKNTGFACSPKIMFSNSTTELCNHTWLSSGPHNLSVEVTFFELQFQPFITGNATGLAFVGYVDNCVGYFTPGIWAGTITSLVLGLILFLAIYIMLGMQVMDKFDDPKGKTINVQS